MFATQDASNQTIALLDDGSGQCVIDPDGAEMLVRRCDEFRRDDLRYRQWALIRNDRLYVLGDFATLGSGFLVQVHEAQPGAADVHDVPVMELLAAHGLAVHGYAV